METTGGLGHLYKWLRTEGQTMGFRSPGRIKPPIGARDGEKRRPLWCSLTGEWCPE